MITMQVHYKAYIASYSYNAVNNPLAIVSDIIKHDQRKYCYIAIYLAKVIQQLHVLHVTLS